MGNNVIVIGAGAAGMMAAIIAAENGASVTILEKMPRVGKKLLITGKGRCNITNIADIKELIKNMHGNGSFLYSSFHNFSNNDLIDFFENLGVKTKVERGGRVFPESDKAIDVVDALLRKMDSLEIRILKDVAVKNIIKEDNKVTAVVDKKGLVYQADKIIVATGGASYPATGSSGDGYVIAEKLGHTITPIKPSLVPLETEEDWVKIAQGLSLKNVKASIIVDDKKVAEDFGEMLFTHYGVSGPIILSLSKIVAENLTENKIVELSINLKPALSFEKLHNRVQRDFEKFSKKQIKNALNELLPSKLIDIIIDLSYINPDKMINQITKEERLRLVEQIMDLRLTITKTRPVAEAIVTADGVSIKEINPKTMESKIIEGLYFAGEIVDVDGYTGGYNLQAAFSMGYIAGKAVAMQ